MPKTNPKHTRTPRALPKNLAINDHAFDQIHIEATIFINGKFKVIDALSFYTDKPIEHLIDVLEIMNKDTIHRYKLKKIDARKSCELCLNSVFNSVKEKNYCIDCNGDFSQFKPIPQKPVE